MVEVTPNPAALTWVSVQVRLDIEVGPPSVEVTSEVVQLIPSPKLSDVPVHPVMVMLPPSADEDEQLDVPEAEHLCSYLTSIPTMVALAGIAKPNVVTVCDVEQLFIVEIKHVA
jgi:hypothetical protein